MSFQSRLPLFGGLAIATGTGTVVSWRLLSSPVYTGPDNWVYAAVGREVAHGHRLDHAFPVTVMKPLAILLGALTTPFPVAHAYQVGVGLCVAALVGFIFFVAFRRAGSVGAVVAVTAFATTPIFWREFFTAPIDFVTSLLIVAAFAARDRARLVVLIFAGLLRPEAWLVAGLVAFDQARGSRSRRSAVALTAMAVAPVTWLVFDAAIAGPNLSTGGGAEGATSVARDIVDSASHVIKSIIIGGGPIVVGLGALGLLVRCLRANGLGRDDFLALATTFGWGTALFCLYLVGIPPSDRYALPIISVFALEAGLATAAFSQRVPRRIGVLAPPAALTAVVLLTLVPKPGSAHRAWAGDYRRVEQSVPTIRRALACGPLAVMGRERVGLGAGTRRLEYFVPEIAAISGSRLDHLALVSRHRSRYPAVLVVYGKAATPPGWRILRLPLGQLSLSAGCSV